MAINSENPKQTTLLVEKYNKMRSGNSRLLAETVSGSGLLLSPGLDEADVRASIYGGFGQKDRETQAGYVEYYMRFRCLQGWFFRCSWIEKYEFLSDLCGLISDIHVLREVLRCIDGIFSKDAVDSFVRYRIDYPYDIIPTDDNRALSDTVLKKCKQADLMWFVTLDSSSQIEIMLLLLRLGGGGLIFSMYKQIEKMHRERKEMDTVLTAFDKPGAALLGESVDSSDRSQDFIGEYGQVKLELISRRNAELAEFKKKFGLGDTPKNGKRKEVAEIVDHIQVLPLWINRKIMLYLNEKELWELKKTGKYWTRMIDDALRESSARSAINGRINKNREKHAEEGGDELRPPRIPVLGQKALLFLLGLRKSDVARAQEENDAFRRGKKEVYVWNEVFFDRRCCCVSNACKLLASSAQSNAIHFHSLRTGARTGNCVTGLPSLATCIALHEEGIHILIGCEDGSLLCFNIRSNKKTMSYPKHADAVVCVLASSDTFVSASGNTIRQHEIFSGLCLFSLDMDSVVTTVTTLDNLLLSGTAEGKLVFIDLGRKKILKETSLHGGRLLDVVEDGGVVVTAGADSTVRLWSLQRLHDAACPVMPFSDVHIASPAVCLSSLTHRIFAGCEDGSLRVICKLTEAVIEVIEVMQKKPIRGVYAIKEKDTTKMIMWHENGIEMRTATEPGRKRKTVERKGRGELRRGRRMVNVVPSSAMQFLTEDRWKVAMQYRATDLKDLERACANRSCTAEVVRSVQQVGQVFEENVLTSVVRDRSLFQLDATELVSFPRLRRTREHPPAIGQKPNPPLGRFSLSH